MDLPAGFPPRFCGPMAWAPEHFHQREQEFVFRFEESDVEEVERGLEVFKGQYHLCYIVQLHIRRGLIHNRTWFRRRANFDQNISVA
jgi:hypothetical protein